MAPVFVRSKNRNEVRPKTSVAGPIARSPSPVAAGPRGRTREARRMPAQKKSQQENLKRTRRANLSLRPRACVSAQHDLRLRHHARGCDFSTEPALVSVPGRRNHREHKGANWERRYLVLPFCLFTIGGTPTPGSGRLSR